jgi:Ca2+-binding RTX toxin-like protein
MSDTTTRRNPASTHPNTRVIESLETRAYLHFADVVNGKLFFIGEPNENDVMIVDIVGDTIRVRATNDGFTQAFPRANVKAIEVTGDSGNDRIEISSAINLPTTLDGGSGNDTIIGGPGKDRIFGGPGDDEIQGNGNRDLLEGGSGNDVISGGNGNDTLIGGSGSDWLIGGAGLRDAVDYASATSGITITIDDLFNDGETNENDQVSGTVEFYLGSAFPDNITGNGKPNFIDGRGGNDILIGGGGNDTIVGGTGRDQLFGQSGNDVLIANDGEIDTLSGGSGTDILDDIDGNDVIID